MNSGPQHPASRSQRSVWAAVGLVLPLVYILSYILMSLGGRYEPSVTGSNGVKRYRWTPMGFSQFDGRRFYEPGMLVYVYTPLLLVDARVWHTNDRVYDDVDRIFMLDKTAIPPRWREFKPGEIRPA